MNTKTLKGYKEAFDLERQNEYPEIEQFERTIGQAISRSFLETCAYPLACPVKVNPPNWQHGRVVYALARDLLNSGREGTYLDIGTAKGFSACMLAAAISHSGSKNSRVVSVDVIDPEARVPRNSFRDLDGYKTVAELVEPFIPEFVRAEFYGGGSLPLLASLAESGNVRIPLAFVDGKHRYDMVVAESRIISRMQQSGDYLLFDDLQMIDVLRAVNELQGYVVRWLAARSQRQYAIARKE